jgi:hypothetical protein
MILSKGDFHEVPVVPGGLCWRGQVYASLSTIARRSPGTNWNGPRFFGLRGGAEALAAPTAALPLNAISHDGIGQFRDRPIKAILTETSQTWHVLLNDWTALYQSVIDLPTYQELARNPATGHTKLESTVRYLGIEVGDALELAERTEA